MRKINIINLLPVWMAVLVLLGIWVGPARCFCQPKVVNGTEVTPGDYPWMASINSFGVYYPICGGSLIHESWVATAAHCVTGDGDPYFTLPAEVLFVTVGLTDYTLLGCQGEVRMVDQVILHPAYDGAAMSNEWDIALLKLDEPSGYSPISLYKDDQGPEAGTMALVLGWGALDSSDDPAYPDHLQEAYVPIVSQEKCALAYINDSEGNITSAHICAGYDEGGTDTCGGDSGGPLAVNQDGQWLLAGITSFGPDSGCAMPQTYGGYTRISAVTDFIYTYINPDLKPATIHLSFRVNTDNSLALFWTAVSEAASYTIFYAVTHQASEPLSSWIFGQIPAGTQTQYTSGPVDSGTGLLLAVVADKEDGSYVTSHILTITTP